MSDIMSHLTSLVPDEAALISMDVDHLAGLLIRAIVAKSPGATFSTYNESVAFDQLGASHRNPKAMQTAVMEAFGWLRSQNLIVDAAATSGAHWYRLSRRAQTLGTASAFAEYRVAQQLPKELLHDQIRDQVHGAFMRGDFDVAVFQAMKAVEVSIRSAAGLGNDLVGVKLARQAFEQNTGPLTDKTVEPGERQARMDLFAGAIGSYKNPQSHRHVALTDPTEAIEQLLLASHLLRIIDSRRLA